MRCAITTKNLGESKVWCDAFLLSLRWFSTVTPDFHMLRPTYTTELIINRTAARVGTFEVCVPTHVALRILNIKVLASQWHFLADRNAELAVPPLLWPVICIKIGGNVALLNGLTAYSL